MVLTWGSLLVDPGRWDRLYYSSRFRDPRSYDRRYWYDAEYDSCRKESYACGDRWAEQTPDPSTEGGP